MLSDAGGKVGAVYGVYDKDAGIEMRERFLIDPDGVIQGYEVLTPPVGRSVSETLRQIQAFQLVRENQGTETTPSDWKPGKKTLKPGPDLVGNVWEAWKTEEAFEVIIGVDLGVGTDVCTFWTSDLSCEYVFYQLFCCTMTSMEGRS